MKASITTIKVKLGERELEFTEAEAKALHTELGKLFEKPATVFVDRVKEVLKPVYMPPVHHWDTPSRIRPNEVTCSMAIMRKAAGIKEALVP